MIVANVLRKGGLELWMAAVLGSEVYDLVVKMSADESDRVSVLCRRESKSGSHHSCADYCYYRHCGFSFLLSVLSVLRSVYGLYGTENGIFMGFLRYVCGV